MESNLISAQVVIKSSNLARAPWVMEQFEKATFQLGPLVGISFSIAGPVERFEEFFKVRADQKGPRPFLADELPLSALDSTLRKHINAVIFTRPPDFGPTGNF